MLTYCFSLFFPCPVEIEEEEDVAPKVPASDVAPKAPRPKTAVQLSSAEISNQVTPSQGTTHLQQPQQDDLVTLLDVGSKGLVKQGWPGAPILDQRLSLGFWPRSLCLWLKPHRLQRANNIIYMGDPQRQRYIQLICEF